MSDTDRNIILTNDDGIDAPGLVAAYDAICDMGNVHVVAPNSERSACSHTITLRRPITIERVQHTHFGPSFSVDGTPADCIRLAFAALFQEPMHLVISGINRGANAGVDTFYSGTVAGAREAAILGVHAIAFSQALRRDVTTDWSKATGAVRSLASQLIEEKLPGPGFWNVNLPAPIPDDPGAHVHRVPVAVHPMPMTFKQQEKEDGREMQKDGKVTPEESRVMQFEYGASYWLRDVTGPSDYSTIRDGGIAVTGIPLYGQF